MQKAVDHTVHLFSQLNVGKASPTMVENVTFDAYGSAMRIKDAAAINTPDPRLIVIQPWDKSLLKAIEKGIQLANIGLNPVVEGVSVRCPIPELSRERRQELVKSSHTMAEDGKVAIRGIRRDVIELAKKANKMGAVSEDDLKRFEKDIQTATDNAIKSIDSHLAKKEQDLLRV